MIRFFRSIRLKLLSNTNFHKYFLYALGEIILVVIGILIALSINNWNENRKDNIRLQINIKSIAKDLIADTLIYHYTIKSLHKQVEAGEIIIPVMESKQKIISDSLEFIMAFNDLTTAKIIPDPKTTWDYLTSSGLLADFPDLELIDLLQDYYSKNSSVITNYNTSALPARFEIRRLKYDLFPNSEHRKFFPTDNPKIPGSVIL